MNRPIAILILLLLSVPGSLADELKASITLAEKAIEEASKADSPKRKTEKYADGKDVLTKAINGIKASKKIYADEEIALLYQYRGVFNYELCEYEQASEDFTLASKLTPEKVTPWLHLSLIKSSSPIDKLRNGKESLSAAEKASKALKAYAAKVPTNALEKFEHTVVVSQLNEECLLATAAALAELGEFKEAIRLIKDGSEEVVKSRLALYRDGKPFRLPAKP
jgi:tetratricopeptide (TPR) repeat protein